MNHPYKQINLGQTIRQYRKKKSYTLEQLHQISGVTTSTLSKIENNQVSPGFDTMHRIANCLDMSLSQLFDSASGKPVPAARLDISYSGWLTNSSDQDYECSLLAQQISNKKLSPAIIKIKARSLEEYSEWHEHGQCSFFYILQGAVIFYSEIGDPIELYSGDSLYHTGEGYNLVLLDGEVARVLRVSC